MLGTLFFSALWSPALALAEENFQVVLKGSSLPPEIRQSIVDALAPESSYAALLKSTTPDINGITYQAVPWEKITSDPQAKADIAEIIKTSPMNFGTTQDSVVNLNIGHKNFVLFNQNSDIASRLGVKLDPAQGIDSQIPDFKPTNPGVPAFRGSEVVALPVNGFLPGLNSVQATSAGTASYFSQPVDVTSADPIVSRLEDELKTFGQSSLVLTLTDENRAKIQPILDRLKSDPETTILPIADATEPEVRQDIPDGVQLLSASNASCNSPGPDWPMPLDDVRKILISDQALLVEQGISAPIRARILIVDSGVSNALAQRPDFRLFLRPDFASALRRGYYWDRVTDRDGKERCETDPGKSSYGMVTSPDDMACYAADPNGGLDPPTLKPMPAKYIPDHGGFVAVLSAGGPDLIDTAHGLSSNIGIGFAKVMNLDNLDGIPRLHSTDQDIAKAMIYAMEGNYNVVNLSLSFVSPNSDNAKKKTLVYLNSSGCGADACRLIVAAAGNIPAELTQNSKSFPAMAALNDTFRNTRRLIVVGGLERDNGVLRPWSDTTYSSEYVDILAPAASVVSLNGVGERTCMSGTSVAAPQVSFVAGMLFSLGYTKGEDVRTRILATADYMKDFSDKAKDGRLLNVVHALDVFSDLLYVKRPTGVEVLRGQLVSESPNIKGPMIPLCLGTDPALSGDNGKADPDRFSMWRSLSDDSAEVWAEGFRGSCTFDPKAEVYFRARGEQKETPYLLSQLARIVPSDFRRVFDPPLPVQ